MPESSDSMYSAFFARKHMTLSFYLKWTEFTRNCEFFPFMGSQRSEINRNKFTISYEYGTLQVKLGYHMFSSIKKEEYMKSELSDIF